MIVIKDFPTELEVPVSRNLLCRMKTCNTHSFSRSEHSMRWTLALSISALVLALSFLIQRSCLLLWVSLKSAVILVLPCVFVFLVIGLRGWKRAVIPPVLFVVGIISLSPHLNPTPIASTESGAVGALVRLRKAIESSPDGSAKGIIGDVLSSQGFTLQRFYRFEYEEGANGYRILALLTPEARGCGCLRNFVIGDDGIVHYTMQPRPATQTDQVVDVPSSLAGTASRLTVVNANCTLLTADQCKEN